MTAETEPSVDLEVLEAKARAAEPGLWEANGNEVGPSDSLTVIARTTKFDGRQEANAAFIAAANPATVLHLISRALAADEAEKLLAEYTPADDEAVGWIRTAALDVTSGNCAFVDDDLHVLQHLAQRAVDAGLTDQLSESIRNSIAASLLSGGQSNG